MNIQWLTDVCIEAANAFPRYVHVLGLTMVWLPYVGDRGEHLTCEVISGGKDAYVRSLGGRMRHLISDERHVHSV